jgi:DnaJ-class molecular chaperone
MTELQDHKCPWCGGRGEFGIYFRVRNNEGIISDSVTEKCRHCNGTGLAADGENATEHGE